MVAGDPPSHDGRIRSEAKARSVQTLLHLLSQKLVCDAPVLRAEYMGTLRVGFNIRERANPVAHASRSHESTLNEHLRPPLRNRRRPLRESMRTAEYRRLIDSEDVNALADDGRMVTGTEENSTYFQK